MNVATPPALSAKDYASDQEVRWCPGCGDYAILKSVQHCLAQVQADPANTVFVSGIGCAARFPYYLNTYGFHTIHGRAAAIATGIKLTRPELDVWVVSGDGDALSIGGNHLLHLLRRNVDVQFLLFNNEIYGLTKGQYSPTSRAGTRSPSTPAGSMERPISAAAFALGSGARFVARGVDTQQKRLPDLLKRARDHRGTSFIEILQNCIVYNDRVHAAITDRDRAEEAQLHLRHGEPLVFGKDGDKGLMLKPNSLKLEVVTLGGGVGEQDLLRHDETDPVLAAMLAALEPPNFPVALGVIYCDPSPSYDQLLAGDGAAARASVGTANVAELLRAGHTWTVEG
ncbi:MAG: 2-oxoacid:ferredoxin oxidoreductase subunit beta [Kiloniellales bacterium]|nr:2-oxoacid:ferredoxin oxidoreductase subunit beta [Kiloniellales bacterium]